MPGMVRGSSNCATAGSTPTQQASHKLPQECNREVSLPEAYRSVQTRPYRKIVVESCSSPMLPYASYADRRTHCGAEPTEPCAQLPEPAGSDSTHSCTHFSARRNSVRS